jgi:hypothetical protein
LRAGSRADANREYGRATPMAEPYADTLATVAAGRAAAVAELR